MSIDAARIESRTRPSELIQTTDRGYRNVSEIIRYLADERDVAISMRRHEASRASISGRVEGKLPVLFSVSHKLSQIQDFGGPIGTGNEKHNLWDVL
jgi:hypothetical protein